MRRRAWPGLGSTMSLVTSTACSCTRTRFILTRPITVPRWDFTQPRAAPLLNVSFRVLFHQVDVQDAPADFAMVWDGDPDGGQLDGPYRGYHRGQVWTNSVTPDGGHLRVSFVSGLQRCCPNGDGGVDCTCQNWPLHRTRHRGLPVPALPNRRSALLDSARIPGAVLRRRDGSV